MADYKRMYGKLFNKVTDVIGELQQVQQETEDIYVQNEDTEISVLKPNPDDNPNG